MMMGIKGTMMRRDEGKNKHQFTLQDYLSEGSAGILSI